MNGTLNWEKRAVSRFLLSVSCWLVLGAGNAVLAQDLGRVLNSFGGQGGETVFAGERTEHGVFVVGVTGSPDFPVENAFQDSFGGDPEGLGDIFVARLDLETHDVIWSTYLGGSGTDVGNGLAVDSAGNVTVSGYTTSIDFPLREPLQTDFGGESDGVIARFDRDGNLLFSTFLGGSGADQFSGIAGDPNGTGFAVAGFSLSEDFPFPDVNADSADTSCGCSAGRGADALVLAFGSEGEMVWGTFLGGTGGEDIALGIDARDNRIYVVGRTNDPNFPDRTLFGRHQGGFDAFWAEYDFSDGTRLNSRLRGGSGDDEARAVHGGFVVGKTSSTDFPLGQSNLQEEYGGGESDGFIAHFAGRNFGSLSTFLGGVGDDGLNGIDVLLDPRGTIDRTLFVAGTTTSPDFGASLSPGAEPGESPLSKGGFLVQLEQPVTGGAAIELSPVNFGIVRSPNGDWDGNWVDGFGLATPPGASSSVWGGASNDSMISGDEVQNFDGTLLGGFQPSVADVGVEVEYSAVGQGLVRATVVNQGPSQAAGVSFEISMNTAIRGLRLILPDGSEASVEEILERCEFVSAESGGGFESTVRLNAQSFAPGANLPEFNIVRCDLGTLLVGDDQAYTLEFEIDPFRGRPADSNAQFSLRATGRGSTVTVDLNAVNDRVRLTRDLEPEVAVPQISDLEVTMRLVEDPNLDERLEVVEVSVVNLGPNLAKDAVLTFELNTPIRNIFVHWPSRGVGFDLGREPTFEVLRQTCVFEWTRPSENGLQLPAPTLDFESGQFLDPFNRVVCSVGELPPGEENRITFRLITAPFEDDHFRVVDRGTFQGEASAEASTVDVPVGNNRVTLVEEIENFPDLVDYSIRLVSQEVVPSSAAGQGGSLVTRVIVGVTDPPRELAEIPPMILRVEHGGIPISIRLISRSDPADSESPFTTQVNDGVFCAELSEKITECVVDPSLVLQHGGQVLLEIEDKISRDFQPKVSVSLSGDGQDPRRMDNFVEKETPVSDLEVEVLKNRVHHGVSGSLGRVFKFVEYQLRVTNHGPSVATNILVDASTVNPRSELTRFTIWERFNQHPFETARNNISVFLPSPEDFYRSTLICKADRIVGDFGSESRQCELEESLVAGESGILSGFFVIAQRDGAKRLPSGLSASFEVQGGGEDFDLSNNQKELVSEPLEEFNRDLAVEILSSELVRRMVNGKGRLSMVARVRIRNQGMTDVSRLRIRVPLTFRLDGVEVGRSVDEPIFIESSRIELPEPTVGGFLVPGGLRAGEAVDYLLESVVEPDVGSRPGFAEFEINVVTYDGFESILENNLDIGSVPYRDERDLTIELLSSDIVFVENPEGQLEPFGRLRARIENHSFSETFDNVRLVLDRPNLQVSAVFDPLISSSFGEPNCVLRPGQIDCEWPSLGPNGVIEVEILDPMPALKPESGAIFYDLDISSSTGEDNLENNSVASALEHPGVSDLSLATSHCRIEKSGGTEAPRASLQWTLSVGNLGPDMAKDVRLSLPAAARDPRLRSPELLKGTEGASFGEDGVVRLGSLDVGAFKRIRLQFEISDPAESGVLNAEAILSSATLDRERENNLAALSCQYLALFEFQRLGEPGLPTEFFRIAFGSRIGDRYRIERSTKVDGAFRPIQSIEGNGKKIELEVEGQESEGYLKVVIEPERKTGD